MFSKRKVKKYVDQIATYVDQCDTPKEVRQKINYAFMVMMISELIRQGIPDTIAAQAAARMTVSLPENFHIDYPDDFSEIIFMFGKSLTVLYETIVEDFDESLVESVFLALADDVELNMSI